MSRWKRTGTGPGEIIGRGVITFYLRPEDGKIGTCSVEWNGDDSLISLLPGIAFDQYFPNLREVQREQEVLRAKAAQEATLADFESFVDAARKASAPERFDMLQVIDPPEHEVGATAEFVVRRNDGDARLWSETNYSSKDAEALLFSVPYRVLWDWVVARGQPEEWSRMLDAVGSQFDYYAQYGIPSDFRMREIGKAPFTAFEFVSRSADDWVEVITDRASILAVREYPEQAEIAINSGPQVAYGLEKVEEATGNVPAMWLSLSRLGFCFRYAEIELVPGAVDQDCPGWIPILEAWRYTCETNNVVDALVAAANYFASDSEATGILLDSVPGLSAATRQQLIGSWLALCDDRGLSASVLGPSREWLLLYGYAVGVVREAALVAQERADADREGRPPVV